MKKKLTYFIVALIVCSFVNCSSDNNTVAEVSGENESKSTKSKEDPPEVPDVCNPLGPGMDSHFAHSGGGGGDSFHWICSSCGFINAFYYETCVGCGEKNTSPVVHQDPVSPIPNPYYPQYNTGILNAQWYTKVNAQKYYIDISKTYKYQNNSNYADGVNYAWFGMVKIMKLNDAEVTILKCKKFVNFYLPLVENSYKDGYKDGAIAAIESYNAYASRMIATFEISDELGIIL